VTKPTVISLFTGAMGLDLGFEQAGFEVCIALDKDKYAKATIKANRPEIPVISEDISEVSGAQLLEEANLVAGEATVLTGASPCEPFSTIGKRLSIADKRASLIDEFIRLVLETQPSYWVFENVPGLLWAAKRHISFYTRTDSSYQEHKDEQPGSAWKDILTAFEATGYKVGYKLLNAADYGVPQKRKRLIVIGSRDGEIQFPPPTHGCSLSLEVAQGKLKSWATVGETLDNFNDPYPEHMKFPQWGKYIDLVPEGGCWKDIPKDLQEEAIGRAYQSSGGRTGFLRRLSRCRPSPTLVDSPITRAACLCHPLLNRPLTVGEYLHLQGFPLTWKIEGPLSTKYRLIGQATPVPLAHAIAKTILSVTKKSSPSEFGRVSRTREAAAPSPRLGL
jgi:DNA (cytosine-5)-methyltransferase 1